LLEEEEWNIRLTTPALTQIGLQGSTGLPLKENKNNKPTGEERPRLGESHKGRLGGVGLGEIKEGYGPIDNKKKRARKNRWWIQAQRNLADGLIKGDDINSVRSENWHQSAEEDQQFKKTETLHHQPEFGHVPQPENSWEEVSIAMTGNPGKVLYSNKTETSHRRPKSRTGQESVRNASRNNLSMGTLLDNKSDKRSKSTRKRPDEINPYKGLEGSTLGGTKAIIEGKGIGKHGAWLGSSNPGRNGR